MATDLAEVQKRLWDAADELRANSGLQASEYSAPVLGLIFLRFAEERFATATERLGPGSARPRPRDMSSSTPMGLWPLVAAMKAAFMVP
jgi:hypothetical protein